MGTMQLVNEASSCADIAANTSYYNVNSVGEGHDLQSLLARPVLLNTVNLDPTPGPVLDVDFTGYTQFRNAFGATQWDRIIGYAGIRCTLVFTCVVTKTAFHQGIIHAHFQYGVAPVDQKYRGRHFPLATHLPNVRMNLADQTMMQLKVPYVGTEDYIRVSGTTGVDILSYGTFGITNLTGCRVGPGQTEATVTVYVHMEDVELIGPMPFAVTNVATQAGGTSPLHAAAAANSVAKAGAILKEAKDKKIVSKTLNVASKVARVASYVPGLGPFAGAADWFLTASAKTASALGFSKPVDETPITRVVRTAYAFEGQTDIPNPGPVLAPFQSNKLAIDGSLGCTEEDQMSMDYVLGKYSYIYRGRISTDDAVGDVVYSGPVTPSAMWYRDRGLSLVGATGNLPLKTGSTNFENAFYPSTLCYVSDNFRYFRGGFVYKVSFASTKLHGGRVLFSFVPFRNNYAPGTPVSNTIAVPNVVASGPTPSGYSVMFDLQDDSSFEFEVPYVYPDNYCNVLSGAIGGVSMVVVAPLSATNSVPTVVDFMVEVKAMPGFSLSCVTSSMMQGIPNAGIVAVSFQSGVPVTEIGPEASQQCMGEEVLSLKTLIQLPDYYRDTIAAGATIRTIAQPWFKPNAPPLAVPMPTNTRGLFYASKSSRVAEMYSYVRGATNAIIWKAVDDGIVATVSFAPDDGGIGASTPSSFYDKENNGFSAATIVDGKSSMRIVIPTYARYPRIPLAVRDSAFGGALTGPALQVWNQAITAAVPELSVRNLSQVNIAFMVGRAAADDAMCSQFVGPPPVILLNSLNVNNPVFGSARVM